MSTTTSPSAKNRVLAWVRSKNPQTMELKFGCKVLVEGEERMFVRRRNSDCIIALGDAVTQCYREFTILGSDMGLQELLIALEGTDHMDATCERMSDVQGWGSGALVIDVLGYVYDIYDLTKNLHDQAPEFYEAILPIVP